MKIEEKIKLLKNYLKNKKCILAFSAGSDSTLLAYILSQVSKDSILITIDNEIMPSKFIEYATKKSEELKLNHKTLTINFLNNNLFTPNDNKRCYNCRDFMYSTIQSLPEFNEYDYFIEGTNITDLLEDRPGILISNKYHMISPLIECKFKKEDVINALEFLNLDYSNNTTCLATRIKTNETITSSKIKRVSNAENIIRKLIKQKNIRVRSIEDTAIISLDNPKEILENNNLEYIKNKLIELNFNKILLNLKNYEKNNFQIKKQKNKYSYKLPYSIELNKTILNLEKQENIINIKKTNDFIKYDNVIIYKNGEIKIENKTKQSINITLINEYFYNSILPYIIRKMN